MENIEIEKIECEEITDLNLARFLFEHGQFENLTYLRSVIGSGILHYEFKSSDELTTLIRSYMKENESQKSTMTTKSESIFVCTDPAVAEKLCVEFGYSDYLVGYRLDFKKPDKMVHVFKNDYYIYDTFKKLMGWRY